MNTAQIFSPYLVDVLQIIEAATERYPDSRDLALHHAELLAECGKHADALSACEQFLARFGVDGRILELAAGLRRNLGARSFVPTVSLCMIVKNEERYLAQCLASVKPIVDEMIVVDTGSTDHTLSIAQVFGATVHHFNWTGSFSDARNYAISRANGKWILIMDADERISPRDYDGFRAVIRESLPTRDAWSVPIRNYSNRVHIQGWTANDGAYPEEERADGWYPAERVRLFPNDPRIRYEGVVHELVEPALRQHGFTIHEAPIVAHHYGEIEGLPDNLMEKQLRYYELGKQKLNKNPNDLVALSELAVQAGELGLFDEELALWDRLLALRPDTVEALFGKGHALINLKRYVEASKVSLRALQLDPGHREAAFNYGTCELYAGDPGRALPVVERLLKQDQRHPQLLALSILLCLATDDLDGAKRSFETLAAMNYNFSDYLAARVANLSANGRQELAWLISDNAAKLAVAE